MDKNPLGGYDQVRTNAPRQNLLKPAGPIDPEVCVVDVRTRNRGGRPLGLIANYALHYVGGVPKIVEEDGKVVGMASADYFGEFARVMPYRIGGSNPPDNFVAFMTNGTSGDINNIDFHSTRAPRAPFEQIRIVAAKTADAAWRAVKKIETYDDDPLIAMRQREITLKYRVPPSADVEKALALLELPRKEQEAINGRTGSVARNTVAYAGADKPDPEKVIIQTIRIGDQAIVSMPFEVLVEIGLEIKDKSPFPHTFTIELANGGYGYLPPPNQHKLGGYETWLGTSRLRGKCLSDPDGEPAGDARRTARARRIGSFDELSWMGPNGSISAGPIRCPVDRDDPRSISVRPSFSIFTATCAMPLVPGITGCPRTSHGRSWICYD